MIDYANTLNLTGLEQKYGLPVGLLSAVMNKESSQNPNAISPKGATGLFQFMPETAKAYGVDPLVPEQAANGAARMFADLHKQYSGDLPSMLAAYNWGSGNLAQNGIENAPAETRDYISTITQQLANSGQVQNDGIDEASVDAEIAALEAELGGTQDEAAIDAEIAALEAELSPTKAAPKPKKSALESLSDFAGGAITGAADSASFGFGDEIAAGVGSPIRALASQLTSNPENISQAYESLLSANRVGKDIINERSPVASVLGQIGGALGTGVVGAGTKLGRAALSGVSRGLLPQATGALGRLANLATKAGVAGTAGAGQGALYGYGSADEGDRAEGAGRGATMGAIVGGAIPVVGSALGKIANATADEVASLIPKTPQTMKDLRKAAKPLYDAFTKSGGKYSSKLTDEIADLAEAAKSSGIAGETKAADEALNNTLDYYTKLRGKELNPAELQKLDQSFSDDIARFNKAGEYNFGRILNELKYEFRNRAFDPVQSPNYIKSGSASAVKNLQEANRLYSQSYKAADIEKILAKAKGTNNPQEAIRTGIKNLLANDKKMIGYSDAEKAILEDAMKRGLTGGLAKIAGGRLTDSLAGGAAGFAAGGAPGAVVGTLVGKAAGGALADVGGAIQANRLKGALQNIQAGKTAAKQKPELITAIERLSLSQPRPDGNMPKAKPLKLTISKKGK